MAMILIVGPSMAWKTVAAATFPKPMKYLDYDGNSASIFRTKDKLGNLIVPETDKIEVISMAKTKGYGLNFRTDLKATSAPAYTKASMEIYEKYNKLVDEFDKLEVGVWKTLVIDSLTQMFNIWREVVMQMNQSPVPRIPDYMTMEGQLVGAFLPTLRSFLNDRKFEHVILIDHTQVDKDEVTGVIDEFPIGPSKNMGRNIGKYMDDVLFQKIEGGKAVWKTKASGFFKYAGSRHNIPDGTEALYKNVEQYFK